MKEIIEHLRKLASGEVEPRRLDCGVCLELRHRFHFEIPEEAYDLWEMFTGSVVFPVPHPDMSARHAFMLCDNGWSDDEYGDNRRDLCQHLADWLESNYTDGEVTK